MMKKVAVLGSILVASMLSGCFFVTETIVCTKSGKESGMDSTQRIEAVFKSKKVQTMNMDVTVDLSNQPDGMVGVAKSVLESNYEDMNAEGVKTSVTQEKKKLNVNIDLDFEKASKESLEKVDSNFAESKGQKVDTEEFMKQLEDEGYKCEK